MWSTNGHQHAAAAAVTPRRLSTSSHIDPSLSESALPLLSPSNYSPSVVIGSGTEHQYQSECKSSDSVIHPPPLRPPHGTQMSSAVQRRPPETSWPERSSTAQGGLDGVDDRIHQGNYAPMYSDDDLPISVDRRPHSMHGLPSVAGPSPRPLISTRPATSSGASQSFHPYTAPTSKAAPIFFINTTASSGGGFDGSGQVRQKRKRIMPEQLEHLCTLFEKTDSPSYDMREQVANKVGMSNREVQVWFQNRRAKVARQKAAEMGPPKETVKPTPSVRPPPMSAFTSRFAAASEPVSLGSHSWRVKSQAADGTPGTPDPSVAQVSSFRLPPAVPLRPNGLVGAAPADQISSHARTYRVGRVEEEGDGGPYAPYQPRPSPSLALPLPSPSPSMAYRSPGASSLTSPSSGTGYSPYVPMLSPSMSSSYTGSHAFGTPSSYSTSGSSYFSHPETPHSPGSYSSPGGGHFFRLTLDSPVAASGCSSRESPRPGAFEHSPPIPATRDGPIHLRPILSPEIWDERHRESARERQRQIGGHGRSQSDGDAVASAFGSQRREEDDAQSFGARVDERTSTLGFARRPRTSPSLSPRSAHQAQIAYSSQIAAELSKRVQYLHRRKTGPRPSSLSQILPPQPEEYEMNAPADRDATPQAIDRRASATSEQSEPLGLGMLAVAASEHAELAGAEDEAELRARERYLATRRLSLAPGTAVPVVSEELAMHDV